VQIDATQSRTEIWGVIPLFEKWDRIISLCPIFDTNDSVYFSIMLLIVGTVIRDKFQWAKLLR